MKQKLLTAIALSLLCLVTLIVTVNSSRAQRTEFESPQSAPEVIKPLVNPPALNQRTPTDCAIQPGKSRASAATRRSLLGDHPITLSRFRSVAAAELVKSRSSVGKHPPPDYTPQEAIALIDPTNFGNRYLKDVNGNPANLDPIVVLHETVAPVSSTINFFRTPHPKEADQASYHTLIAQDGTIIYLVPPDKRAYGAGNSVFNGRNGREAVKTHPKFSASVNNFAYHISLETPAGGMNDSPRHRGYSDLQYQSLAWLVAKTGVADDRITTHKAVDRSNSRMDPRSFSFSRFFQLLQTYNKTVEIPIRCTMPPEMKQAKGKGEKAKGRREKAKGKRQEAKGKGIGDRG